MSVPGIVQSTLDGDEIAARVSLGGEDELFITPRSSIVYRADGLLSDESIDEFPHDADRLTLSEGRRKTRFSLEYALDGTRDFTVPSSKTEAVLHPVLAGILNGNGITDPGETVAQTYRFSELTLIVTSDRLVKHIGEAVWDGDFEQYHFDDVTNLSFEDGSVATQIVLEVDGRPQRIKAPNDEATDVSERLKRALFAYHDVDSLAALNDAVGVDEEEDSRDDPAVAFGDGVDPLDANPPEPDDRETVETDRGPSESESPPETPTSARARDPLESTTEAGTDASVGSVSDSSSSSSSNAETRSEPTNATAGTTEQSTETATVANGQAGSAAVTESESGSDAGATPGATSDSAATSVAKSPTDENTTSDGFEGSGFQAATPDTDPELLARLADLEATVAEQNDLLEQQQRTIEQLIEELRQGR
ncbi:DUF7115 domain-containing protein [Natronoglomus mannanivorans]|uniref:DUF7115 domain-containing protein n=1 Tax=Natronoglomus mannanivorans TaxID=2979990 RepID=A0AAP2YVH1_9EURY|nr:hypothetical protein [Halobacteria archaeon AArc-xg1-1]